MLTILCDKMYIVLYFRSHIFLDIVVSCCLSRVAIYQFTVSSNAEKKEFCLQTIVVLMAIMAMMAMCEIICGSMEYLQRLLFRYIHIYKLKKVPTQEPWAPLLVLYLLFIINSSIYLMFSPAM